MAPFLDILGKTWKGIRQDDDFANRLNHRYTAIIFIVFAVVVMSASYVGDPIHCWMPGEFKDSHKSYANNYCWIKNTYYIPFEERIPGADLPRPHIGYYQWVPIVMLLQALLFYFPVVFWRLMSGATGIDVHAIVKGVSGLDYLDPEKRATVIKYLVRHMDRYFGHKKDRDRECFGSLRTIITNMLICCGVGKRFGNYLIFLFMWVKALYVANSIGQLFLLNTFLGTKFHLFGFEFLRNFMDEQDWTTSGRFPRVTLCDFKMRQLGGNIHRWTIQCVLPINLFNEKIYLFIWFWLIFVSAVTVFGFLTWLAVFFVGERKEYIKKNLKLMGDYNTKDKDRFKKFVTEYLKVDGVFVCKLIQRNTNDVIVSEFVAELWDFYKNKPENKGMLGENPEVGQPMLENTEFKADFKDPDGNSYA
ncbi:innexin unc-9 [Lingula anatina]|uniref:Innexin n=1 Tax=Lingula anatina TaxID=7574 RepID=A0A1S3JZA2_LINAN|nr:innexin unc-9 [Lingula anatina]|eukprot:XP_013415361.1 innexin unc-9 [Lingula anatina]